MANANFLALKNSIPSPWRFLSQTVVLFYGVQVSADHVYLSVKPRPGLRSARTTGTGILLFCSVRQGYGADFESTFRYGVFGR